VPDLPGFESAAANVKIERRCENLVTRSDPKEQNNVRVHSFRQVGLAIANYADRIALTLIAHLRTARKSLVRFG
jgi:hypothetical protein